MLFETIGELYIKALYITLKYRIKYRLFNMRTCVLFDDGDWDCANMQMNSRLNSGLDYNADSFGDCDEDCSYAHIGSLSLGSLNSTHKLIL